MSIRRSRPTSRRSPRCSAASSTSGRVTGRTRLDRHLRDRRRPRWRGTPTTGDTKKAPACSSTSPSRPSTPWPKMEPVVIKARDGFELMSYLTVPNGCGGKEPPPVPQRAGGPWGRDTWVDPRRSGSRPRLRHSAGRRFAAPRVWQEVPQRGRRGVAFGTMQHDLTDAVKWAIAKGIADRKKKVLRVTVARTAATQRWRGSFSRPAVRVRRRHRRPRNIKTLFQAIRRTGRRSRRSFVKRVGDVENDEALNRKISPLFYADHVRVPLIIAQGANDPRVEHPRVGPDGQGDARQGLACLRRLHRRGPGSLAPTNGSTSMAASTSFLGKQLGGRVSRGRRSGDVASVR